MIAMDRAVRPNLFDVAAQPRLAFVLTLANLMSPRLWDMAEKVRHKPATDRMQALHDYVNGHFAHVLPWDVSEEWGVLELAEERERLGAAVVDDAISKITAMFDIREQMDLLPQHIDARPMIATGVFPAYFYATVDEAIACRRLMRRKKHKPLGRTSCMDEAAVIASLLCLFRGGISSEIAFLATDFHYSVIELDRDEPVWFNGKKDYFPRSVWQEFARRSPDRGQSYIDQFMYFVDRIIAPVGVFRVASNRADMPAREVSRLARGVCDFFGPELRQTAPFQQTQDTQIVAPAFRDRFPEAFSEEGADALRANVRRIAAEQPGGGCEAALYCYRSMEIPDPRPYLLAARRAVERTPDVGHIRTMAEARERVAAVTGTDSILDDRWRIATPDETLHYDTGSDRDRALLLFAYACRLAEGEAIENDLEIRFTESGSYVHDLDGWCDAMTGRSVPEPAGEPLASWHL
ncbi:MAG: hypothetical protein ACFB50_02245 [Rubrobacteraceae bacterium]